MGDPRQDIQDAIANRDKNAVKRLLAAGLDVNSNLGGGLRPIHVAIGTNDRDMISFLDSSGADLAIRSGDGSTPLHYAVKEWKTGDTSQEKVKTIEHLLRLGADVNATNAQGVTALDLATAANQNTVAAALRRYGGKEGPGAASLPKESTETTVKRHLSSLQAGAPANETIDAIVTLCKAEDEDGLKQLVRHISAGAPRMEPDVGCDLLVEVGRLCASREDLASANRLFQTGKPMSKKAEKPATKGRYSSFLAFRGQAGQTASSGGGSGGTIVKAVVGLVVLAGLGFGGYKFATREGGGPVAVDTPTPVNTPIAVPATPGATPSATPMSASSKATAEEKLAAAKKALEEKQWVLAVREGEQGLDAGAQGELRKEILQVIAEGYLGGENYDGAKKVYEELKDEEGLGRVKRALALRDVDQLLNQARRGLRRGAVEMAEASVDKAITSLRDHEGEPERLADALALKGDILIESGRFGAGEDTIKEAAKLAPDSEEIQNKVASVNRAAKNRLSRKAIQGSFSFPATSGSGGARSAFYLLSDSPKNELGHGGEYFLGDEAKFKAKIATGEKDSTPALNVEAKGTGKPWTVSVRTQSGKEPDPGTHKGTIVVNGTSIQGGFKIHEMQALDNGKVNVLSMDFHGTDENGEPVFGRVRIDSSF
ncbi:MAG: ankyrin repeat domain-containing protein [Vulcanimicrobiota bacterium]